MNKKELVASVAKKKNLSLKEVEDVLDGILETITKSLLREEAVMLLGFGTFSMRQHVERVGYNPSTKEKMLVPAKKVVKFKPGVKLELGKKETKGKV